MLKLTYLSFMVLINIFGFELDITISLVIFFARILSNTERINRQIFSSNVTLEKFCDHTLIKYCDIL